MKKLTLLLAVLMLLASLAGCGKKEEPIEIVDDNYRNVCEIFVASYYDSDGDGSGDLKGVTGKLDYLADMGYTGIWMMPIHPSPSYHKYDVLDYYDIDPAYGNLDDFRQLVEEAHKRNINIIIDLVVNHSSNHHPWFIEAVKAQKEGTDSPYKDWYNFSWEPRYGYASAGDGLYYEARFVDSMPDLNLDNESLKAELVKIMKYWLDMGVDGFRLDAVTSYYTDSQPKCIHFLSWLNEQAKAIKEDCYLVGECWSSDTVISAYYESGLDSFFLFSLSQAEGSIVSTIRTANSTAVYRKVLQNVIRYAKGHIPAVFLDNHDMGRITSAIGRTQPEKTKFVYGMAGMLNGTLFSYYGTEIGMIGSKRDENYRIAMLWDSDSTTGMCKNPPNATQSEYCYPGVKQQLKDENSILNYHKQINRLRNRYPEIPRGELNILEEYTTAKVLI
ncbi:MAG: hypothetical protein IJI05_00435, partial [Erysipelotrichaceae bacterium]|nr:hypothetical protein [Erysipelotrichaceae bacterium]